MISGLDKSPIFRDTYCLTQEIFSHTLHFSRDFKFILGTSLNKDCIDLCTTIYTAYRENDKQLLLKQYAGLLDRIKMQLRLCADFKLLSFKQQADLALRIDNLTRQIIAWQKSERKRQINHQSSSCRNQE